MHKVLTIEDDPETAEEIASELASHGFEVQTVADGIQGLALARQCRHDLITLDRMLPGLDGLSLVSQLRALGVETPVLMISALSDVDERIRGLRAGGDDYMVKPFEFDELLARIEVLLRRRRAPSGTTQLQVGDLRMDLVARKAWRGGTELGLIAKEFKLLEYMMRNAGQVLTKRMILEEVWNFHFDPATNLIEVHIARLRKKIELPGLPPLIQTIRGSGYLLGQPT